MKKITYTLLALLILAGCQEDEWFGNGGKQEIRVTASLTSTRTVFAEDGSVTYVCWEKGDAIGLFTKDQSNLEYLTKEAGKETEFSGAGSLLQAAEGDSVYAYYPYSSYRSENPYCVALPSILWQYYDKKETAYDFLYASGRVDDNQLPLQFHHLFAYLKITIPLSLIPDRGDYGGLFITSTETIGFSSGQFDLQKRDTTSMTPYKSIQYQIADSVEAGEVTCYIAILPQSAGATLSIYHMADNKVKDCILRKKAPVEGFRAGNIYTLYLNEDEAEMQLHLNKEALNELYQATNGDNWTYNTNWCSDKPLGEWYGVTTNSLGIVTKIDLRNNNLTGTLPSSMSNLTQLTEFRFNRNNLSGDIPKSITESSYWSIYGLVDVVQQSGYYFNFSTTRLQLPAFSKTDLMTSAPINNVDILKEKELTVVYLWSTTNGADCFNLTSLYNRYKDYGLNILGINVDNVTESSLKSYIQENNVGEWYHISSKSGMSFAYYYPTVLLFNRNAECLYYNMYAEAIEKDMQAIIYDILGEGKPLYESTDYSRDGEYKLLQKATVGKGIDLVFMGEAFADKDIASGAYEQKMKEAMEQFFSMEPYATFRNRFNVHMVNVVSKNNEFAYGAEHRIDGSDSICFVYAQKIPDINSERLQISVIYNATNTDERSYTTIYSDGTFVGYMKDGVSIVLNHESGGHGFAKLLDEYVEGGYESATYSEEGKQNMDNIWNWYGWGANVDWRNDPTTVKWAHFLSDSRYTGEKLGIYEGAYLVGIGCYRPTENSVMRYHWMGDPFNAPSREQIYKCIMQQSEGNEWTYDYEKFVEYDAVNRNYSVTRGLRREPSKDELETYKKRHCPPVFVKGTWRDVLKK